MPAGMQLGSHCSSNELLFFDPVSTVVAILSLQTSHRDNTRSIANLPVFHELIKGWSGRVRSPYFTTHVLILLELNG
jgi:hypothetical protein